MSWTSSEPCETGVPFFAYMNWTKVGGSEPLPMWECYPSDHPLKRRAIDCHDQFTANRIPNSNCKKGDMPTNWRSRDCALETCTTVKETWRCPTLTNTPVTGTLHESLKYRLPHRMGCFETVNKPNRSGSDATLGYHSHVECKHPCTAVEHRLSCSHCGSPEWGPSHPTLLVAGGTAREVRNTLEQTSRYAAPRAQRPVGTSYFGGKDGLCRHQKGQRARRPLGSTIPVFTRPSTWAL